MKIIFWLALLFLCSIPVFAGSKDCPAGQHWVKKHNRRAYTRADGTLVKATVVSDHCRSAREIDKHWHGAFDDTKPAGWPYRIEKSKNWTVEEMERALEAICELPEEIWKKSSYKVYRMGKSKDGKNPATSARNILVLYDSAFGEKNVLSRILAHEFAHEIYGNLSASDAKDYRLATNWFEVNRGGRRILVSRKEGFVADDGRVSPEEDFANNLEFFLFEGSILKSQTPHAYRWLAEHYGDKLKLRKCEK